MQLFTAQSLNQSFNDKSKWPMVESLTQNENEISLSLLVPENLECFAGHFPDQAVLPGVVQVHWVGMLSKKLFGLNAFQSLKSIKFNSMLFPGSHAELRMSYQEEKGLVKFSYTDSDNDVSSGMLVFANFKE